MYIYYKTNDGSILMRLREDDRWYLLADMNTAGVATLYINVQGKEYPLLTRRDLHGEQRKMADSEVLDYFNEMIHYAFQMVRGGKRYIDFEEIEFTLDTEVPF